jgi:hypothetical protein
MAQIDATWPEAQPTAAPDAPDWGEPAGGDLAEGASADFGRLGLILCFLSAVLTLAGVGSALERIFS